MMPTTKQTNKKNRGDIMNWKLEWAWESDHFFGSDTAYFETEEDAMDFVKKVKENPYREITSMYLTYVKRLV